MIKRPAFIWILAAAAPVFAEIPAPTNSAATSETAPKSISVQEMLVIGPSGLKLHSLAMITQGKVKGEIDERFLPGFKVCSEDPAIPIRSVCARIMGEHMVAGKDTPNPEAVALLTKLAKDESSDVRYSAIYYGLTQMKSMPNDIISLLVDIAATQPEPSLSDRIVASLKNYPEATGRIMDEKLASGNAVAIFEIYEDLTGKPPADSEQYLAMPSSQPRMFIFQGGKEDAETLKAELESELNSIGAEGAEVRISAMGGSYVLTVKTYLTKDRLAVEKHFADPGKFSITQAFWLTPELEAQLEAMHKMRMK